MKKAIILLLATSLLATVLTGCGKSSENQAEADISSTAASEVEEDKTKIVFWSHFGGSDAEYMQTMVEEFQKANPDIEVETFAVQNEDYYTKLKTGITSGEGPDVATGDADRLAEFKAGNLVQNMKPYAEKIGVDWSTYTENVLNGTIIDGEHLAIPLSSYASIMYVNKTLLEDAGMLNLKEDGTVDFGSGEAGFLKVLNDYQAVKPKDVYTIVGSTNGDEVTRFFWSFYGQTGETLLSEDLQKAQLNSAKGKKALSLLSNMTQDGLWPKNVIDADQIFASGKAAFYMSGVWMTGSLENNKDLDFIAQPIPQLYDNPSAWGGTHIFMMPSKKDQSDKQKEAVVKFADWMASNCVEWTKAGHIPSKPSVTETEEYQSMEHRAAYKEVTNYMLTMPESTDLTAIVKILNQQLPTALSGQETVDKVLASCEKEINNILTK